MLDRENATFLYDSTSSLSYEQQWAMHLRNIKQRQIGLSTEEINKRQLAEYNERATHLQSMSNAVSHAQLNEIRSLRQETISVHSTISDAQKKQVELLDKARQEHQAQNAELISVVYDNTARVVGAVEDLSIDINSALQKLESSFATGLSGIMDEQVQTNVLLGDVKGLLRIPDFQKERLYYIEQGLKFYQNSVFNDELKKDALDNLLKAHSLEPTDYIVLHKIGMIYLYTEKLINIQEAEACLLKAAKYALVDSHPDAIKTANLLTGTNGDQMHLDDSLAIKLLAAESYLQASFAAAIRQDYISATQHAKNAYGLSKNQEEITIQLATVLLKTEKPEEAMLVLSEMLDVSHLNAVRIANNKFLGSHPDVFELLENRRLAMLAQVNSYCNDIRLENESLTKEDDYHFSKKLTYFRQKNHSYLQVASFLEKDLPQLKVQISKCTQLFESVDEFCRDTLNRMKDESKKRLLLNKLSLTQTEFCQNPLFSTQLELLPKKFQFFYDVYNFFNKLEEDCQKNISMDYYMEMDFFHGHFDLLQRCAALDEDIWENFYWKEELINKAKTETLALYSVFVEAEQYFSDGNHMVLIYKEILMPRLVNSEKEFFSVLKDSVDEQGVKKVQELADQISTDLKKTSRSLLGDAFQSGIGVNDKYWYFSRMASQQELALQKLARAVNLEKLKKATSLPRFLLLNLQLFFINIFLFFLAVPIAKKFVEVYSSATGVKAFFIWIIGTPIVGFVNLSSLFFTFCWFFLVPKLYIDRIKNADDIKKYSHSCFSRIHDFPVNVVKLFGVEGFSYDGGFFAVVQGLAGLSIFNIVLLFISSIYFQLFLPVIVFMFGGVLGIASVEGFSLNP